MSRAGVTSPCESPAASSPVNHACALSSETLSEARDVRTVDIPGSRKVLRAFGEPRLPAPSRSRSPRYSLRPPPTCESGRRLDFHVTTPNSLPIPLEAAVMRATSLSISPHCRALFLLCRHDLPCPIRSPFEFAFFQRTFRPFYKEPFRGHLRLPSALLEPVRDALCSITSDLYYEA